MKGLLDPRRSEYPEHLRVLFVTNAWPHQARPWYGVWIRRQAGSLEELGVDVDHYAIQGDVSRGAYLSAAARMATGLNRRRRYDIVHAHYGHSGVVARLQLRSPLVVSFCGDDLLGTRDRGGSMTTRSRLEAAVFRRLAFLTAATITKSQELESRLPASCRGRNHVIPNGVDLEWFKPVDKMTARKRLGWSTRVPVALFAGDPEIPGKNVALARAAVSQASAELPELTFEVAAGISPEQMPLVYSAADALILTSYSEGSPNVVKEAMACELPVVSVPIGDVPERIRDVPGCFVCPPEARQLAQALARAVLHGRSPEARRAISTLSQEAVARRILGVYERALLGRGAPGTRAGVSGSAREKAVEPIKTPVTKATRP